MASDPLIGVTGATGEVGGRVAHRLADRGRGQRLIVRDVTRGPRLDGAEAVAIEGYGDADSMRAAAAGLETLLFVPGEEAPDRIEQHKTVVDAAAAAGVRHLVYLSFVGAAPDAEFTLARHHWATEEHIRDSGVAFTFLRMSMYMDFIPLMAGEDGVIRGPAGDGRVGCVLRDDLADATVAVLTDPAAHRGATYDVTGPQSITLGEAAATMASATGKPVRFHDETIEEAWASRRPSGAPDWEIEGWISSYTALAAGELDIVGDSVRRLAGHDPTTLEDYVRAHPASLDHVHG